MLTPSTVTSAILYVSPCLVTRQSTRTGESYLALNDPCIITFRSCSEDFELLAGIGVETHGIRVNDIVLEELDELGALRVSGRAPIRAEHESRYLVHVEALFEEAAELALALGLRACRGEHVDRPGPKVGNEARRIVSRPRGAG